jgi:hypothetical protein
LDHFIVSNNKIGGNLPVRTGLETYYPYYGFRFDFSNNRFTGYIPSCYNIQVGYMELNVSGNRLNSLETVLNKSNVTLNIKNQEIWVNTALQINPGMDCLISLPNICIYSHYNQNFSANNTFSVYLENDNIGVVTSEQGILIIPAIMLANATPGAALTLVQATGDAQGTKIRYNQGSAPEIYSIKGKVIYKDNPLQGVKITYEDGSATTNELGNYSITVEQNATVTLTPSLTNFTFSPPSITCVNVTSDQTGKNFIATSTVDIIEISEDEQILIYPNPTRGELIIKNYELGITNIEIFDMMGRKQQFSRHCGLDPQLHSQFSIHHLPAGMYFIRIQTDGSTGSTGSPTTGLPTVITKKIVKQ